MRSQWIIRYHRILFEARHVYAKIWIDEETKRNRLTNEKTYEDRIGLIKAGFKAVRAVAIMAMKMARWAVKPSKKYRCWQNFAVNEVIPHCYEIGWFWEKVTWFNQR